MSKSNFKIISKLFSGVLLSFMMAASAQAALFTQTEGMAPDGGDSFNPNDTGFISVLGSQNLSSFSQFNPALGMLQSVTLFIDGTLFYDAEIIGIDVIDDNLDNSVNVDFLVGMGIGAPINGVFSLTTFGDFSQNGSCFETSGSGPCSGDTSDVIDVNFSETFTGVDMIDFIGLGDLAGAELELLAGLQSPMALTNLDNAILDILMGFDGSVTVQYETASAVPLPAAVWFLGSGLIGLLGMRKKASA